MSYDLEIGPRLQQQLADLFEWERTRNGEAVAARAINNFEQAFADILAMPGRFPPYNEERYKARYRVAPAWHHKIVYHVAEDDGVVIVFAIGHEAQSPTKLDAQLP